MKTIDKLNEDWLLASEINKIEARLWRKTRRDHLKVVMITSAGRGEGKSTTVAFLATVLGLHPDRKILAVDLDFRDPKLNSHLELEIRRGLGAVLRGECGLQDAIIKSGLPGLDVVLPDSEGEDPELFRKTQEFANMFDFFRKAYDLVLVDVPALLPVADATAVIPFVDAVILMAMAGKTTRPQLNRAREICLGMDASILGLIIGNLKDGVPEYGESGYRYGYGYGYGRRPTTNTGSKLPTTVE